MMTKRKKLIIANWKMKLSHKQSLVLAKQMVKKYKTRDDLEVVLCPSFTSLEAVGEIIKDSSLKLGAQDIFYHNLGSYTGEISPAVVRELGAGYVIIGHSERRKLGESNDDVNRKIQAALENNLIPIVCVGETFDEYQNRKTDVIIIEQVTKALEDIKLKEGQRLILAYEPVWVIGSGQAVEHDIVGHIAQIIIHTTVDMDSDLVDKFSVIYGGSVDEENVNDFIIGNISTGVIVGGNSLKAVSFLRLLENIK
jgi:triosephosphate isomerase